MGINSVQEKSVIVPCVNKEVRLVMGGAIASGAKLLERPRGHVTPSAPETIMKTKGK